MTQSTDTRGRAPTSTAPCSAARIAQMINTQAASGLSKRTAVAFETFQQLRSLLEDAESLSGEIIKQVLATSRVASMKYDLLDRAMLFFFAALVSLAATASVFALHHAGHWL